MEINKIDEKFLLSLLDTTDSVYYNNGSRDEHYFYFYPVGLGLTVQIPCLRSHALEVNFKFDEKSSMIDSERYISCALPNITEVPNLIEQLFLKNQDVLNSFRTPTIANDKITSILSQPLEQLNISNKNENLIIRQENNHDVIQINIGRALYSYSNSKIFNPLTPIELDCFISTKDDKLTNNVFFKKLIPAFQIENFPALQHFAVTNNNITTVYELLQHIKEIKPESAPMLHSFILNNELESREYQKNKFKV